MGKGELPLTLLAILFVILKTTGTIDWPWIAVLSPLWLPLAVVAIMYLTVIGGIAGYETYRKVRAKLKSRNNHA